MGWGEEEELLTGAEVEEGGRGTMTTGCREGAEVSGLSSEEGSAAREWNKVLSGDL